MFPPKFNKETQQFLKENKEEKYLLHTELLEAEQGKFSVQHYNEKAKSFNDRLKEAGGKDGAGFVYLKRLEGKAIYTLKWEEAYTD